jgi:hypothetical protein
MVESLSGGTTNLLRMARSGCRSSVAFVALALGDQTFATAMYPQAPEEARLTADEIDDLVRQLWLDPGLAQGRALVRTVRLGGRRLAPTRRLATAAVPLGPDGVGRPLGILGVADPEAKSFGLPELELLARIAQRLASYVQARQEVRTQRPEAATQPTASTTGAVRDEGASEAPTTEPWWTVEPSPAAAAAGSASRPGVGSRTLPPFPPPAAVVDVGSLAERLRLQGQGEAAAPAPVEAGGGQPVAGPEPAPSSESAEVVGPERATGVGDDHLAEPHQPDARGGAGAGAGSAPGLLAQGAGGTLALLGGSDPDVGLISLGALIGRAGRLLGAGAAASGSLAVVVVDVGGVADPVADAVAAVARALHAELRFDDPVARIGRLSFVAVVPLAPGGASGDLVEAKLVESVRSAFQGHARAVVRAAHVVAELSSGRDADELLRSAVVKLRAG